MYDNVPMANVSEHLVRTVPVVHPSSTAISPRTVGDVFANTVTEHPAFPGQAYMVAARESARMMGGLVLLRVHGRVDEEAEGR